jgi:hypothetical protein
MVRSCEILSCWESSRQFVPLKIGSPGNGVDPPANGSNPHYREWCNDVELGLARCSYVKCMRNKGERQSMLHWPRYGVSRVGIFLYQHQKGFGRWRAGWDRVRSLNLVLAGRRRFASNLSQPCPSLEPWPLSQPCHSHSYWCRATSAATYLKYFPLMRNWYGLDIWLIYVLFSEYLALSYFLLLLLLFGWQ